MKLKKMFGKLRSKNEKTYSLDTPINELDPADIAEIERMVGNFCMISDGDANKTASTIDWMRKNGNLRYIQAKSTSHPELKPILDKYIRPYRPAPAPISSPLSSAPAISAPGPSVVEVGTSQSSNSSLGLRQFKVRPKKLIKETKFSVMVDGKRKGIFNTETEARQFAEKSIDDALVYKHQKIKDGDTIHSAYDECVGLYETAYRDKRNSIGMERVLKTFDDSNVTPISANKKGRSGTKMYDVCYLSGPSKYGGPEGVDYMLVDVDGCRLYSEHPPGRNENSNYARLKADILEQAAEHRIPASCLKFFYDETKPAPKGAKGRV